MGFGGPVWHASVSAHGLKLAPSTLLAIALQELDGVGDEQLGQWVERGDVAMHVRRRLSDEEAAKVGSVCDVRGTWEGQKRVARMAKYLPDQMHGVEQ